MKTLNDFYNESPTKEKTRASIVQAAIDLFTVQGIASVTLTEISEQCGITIRNLYRYYPSKEYLVVDAAFVRLTSSEHQVELEPTADLTGIESVEALLRSMHAAERSDHAGLGFIRFVMYFDLYMTELDQEHPAYRKYVESYRPVINDWGYRPLEKALKKGIRDGTIQITDDEVDSYIIYLIQSTMSIIMRTIVKETENPTINASLVDKQIEVMIHFLKKEK